MNNMHAIVTRMNWTMESIARLENLYYTLIAGQNLDEHQINQINEAIADIRSHVHNARRYAMEEENIAQALDSTL